MSAERREGQRREVEVAVARERRSVLERRVGVRPGFEGGWLAFRSSHGERRRVAPVPDGWDVLADDELCALLVGASHITARRPDLFD